MAFPIALGKKLRVFLIVKAMGETHNALHIGEMRQSMAQILEKRTVYDHYSSDVYVNCSLNSMWITYRTY